MKTATATSAWLLDEGNRLDASFHLSDGRMAKALFKKSPCPVEPLSKLTTDIFSGPRFRRHYVSSPETGIPFLSGSDIVKADFNTTKLISKKMTNSLEALKVEKGWTLVTRSGTIGLTAFTNDDFLGKALTEDVIRIVPNEEMIESGYLYTFLASKFGYALLTQFNYGGVIKHIEPHHITDLPIPLLPERQRQEIHALIEEAARLRVEGNGLLQEAEDMLIQTLDIESELLKQLTSAFEKDTKMSFVVSASKVTALTLRARNYSPRLHKVIEVLSKWNSDNLIDVLAAEPFYTGRFKRIPSSSKNAIELLSQGAIFEMKPTGNLISKRAIPNLSNEIVKKGTILVPGQGSLGENEIFGRAKFLWGYL